jgi:transposase
MANANEQDIRKEAIYRFLQGEKPKQIYDDLKRSNRWFYKWLKRYQSGDPKWF